MISEEDMQRTFFYKDRFVVPPVIAEWGYKFPEGIEKYENRMAWEGYA